MDAPQRALVIDTSEREWDEALGVYTLYFSVPRFEINFFKLMIESYEGLASGRSMERFQEGGAERSLEVVLAVPDLIEDTRRLLVWLAGATDSRQVPSTRALREALRGVLSEELA